MPDTSAQSTPNLQGETVGTIVQMYQPTTTNRRTSSQTYGVSPYANQEYTQIEYTVNETYRFKVYELYPVDVFRTGQKLMIRYDTAHPQQYKYLLYKPYFAPGELPDTTEGMISTLYEMNKCEIYYKVYDPNDSFDVTIKVRNRYLSPELFDSALIRENYVYKMLYNKSNLSTYNSEILFNKQISTSYTELNRQTYMALFHMTNNSPLEAITNLNACMQLDPGNAFYIFQRAKCYDDLFENEKALEDFNTYIKMSPNETRGYVRRAMIFIRLKKYEEARIDLNKVLVQKPNSDEANYLMGVLLYDTKKYSEAVKYYTKAAFNTTRAEKAFYYYDLALAEKKASNKQSSISDFSEAEHEAIQNNYKRIYGNQPHINKLHKNSHSIYVLLTSDNYIQPYRAVHSDMQAHLVMPYTIQQSGGPAVYNVYKGSATMNHTKNPVGITLGTMSLEVGGYKRLYMRLETGITVMNGNSIPFSMRTAIGYNIKLRDNDRFILRPEIGCTYINQRSHFQSIDFVTSSGIVVIDGQKYTPSIRVQDLQISLRENVFNFSPALGLWFRPYKSRLVFRASIGYTYSFYQNYSLYLRGGNTSKRESLDHLNMSYSNTNGQTANFFKYSGLYAGIGIGVRIK